jgi:hypothetical protein
MLFEDLLSPVDAESPLLRAPTRSQGDRPPHCCRPMPQCSPSPHFDFRIARQFCHRDLPAQGCRSFFAAAIPGPQRPEDVVKPAGARFEPVIILVMSAKALGNELLPSIRILWRGRTGMFLAEWLDVRIDLPILGIDTGR